MTSIRSITSFKLDLPPSCIEFFPLNPQYAIIGTYNLQKPDEEESAGSAPHDGKVSKKNQQRNGSLILVRVLGDNVYVKCDLFRSLEAVGSVIDFWYSHCEEKTDMEEATSFRRSPHPLPSWTSTS
jgi:diphthamide biosynthesis protein 7